jgi:translation initiation factor 6
MEAAKYKIMGSDYVGVYATASDDFVFAGMGLTSNAKEMIAKTLGVRCIEASVSGSDLLGLFSRLNSNGILLSNMTLDHELEAIKKMELGGINVGILDSDLNAIGSNVLANDKIAIINTDYTDESATQIGDILGVEVVKAQMDGFKTVGANNILTNTGLVINNRGTAQEEKEWNDLTGFTSARTTANTGGLSIGLAVIANSTAVIAGDNTTGFELQRIMEALE